MKSAAWTEL